MRPELATVLTVRSNSDRFPNKALATIQGKPLVYWIAKRLSILPGKLIVATTADSSDDKLVAYCKKMRVDIYRDDEDVDDVVGRVTRAVELYSPHASFVFRALGDCPFIEPFFITRAVHLMEKQKAEFFIWCLPPYTWPVYGSREFPYSRVAWNRITKYARASEGEREHVDMYFNNHRSEFKILYHEAPPGYFRPQYRLEVDYEADIKMLREAAKRSGDDQFMLWPVKDVIRLLDDYPDIARINAHCVEKTGPTTSYDASAVNEWFKLMNKQPVYGWNHEIWSEIDKAKARMVFCKSEQCLIGFGAKGRLYTLDGSEIGSGRITCKCGAGRVWEKAI